jgi:hypothetical protein
MSAIAGIGGFFVWILVLALPLLVYFFVSIVREATNEKSERNRWVESRPVKGSAPGKPNEKKSA